MFELFYYEYLNTKATKNIGEKHGSVLREGTKGRECIFHISIKPHACTEAR